MNPLNSLARLSCLLFCTSVGQPSFSQDVNATPADEQTDAQNARRANPISEQNQTSPVRKIERNRQRARDPENPNATDRSYDGSGNNLANNNLNRADTPLARWVEPAYGDLVESLAGPDRPSARFISNALSRQQESIPNPAGASDFLWQWGQFIDHDFTLTDGVDPAEPANIAIPSGDPWFDPTGSGAQTMAFNRSLYHHDSGTGSANPRAQINEITGWIDASQVYGSDAERAAALRTNDGTGALRTSAGNLLPFNEDGLSNAGGSGANLFLAGDVRANEQVGLMTMHTLFVREHNRLVAELAQRQPELSGDQLYQKARRLVAAQLQVITYQEFLPLLLGERAIPAYQGYSADLDARIANLFSAAAFRLGHSMLSAEVLRLDAQGNAIDQGPLALRDAFFAPDELINHQGIEPVLRGLASQVCQRIDAQVVNEVRNFLFGAPGAGGFDLAALNIQRGRDHGLPDYNSARLALGLSVHTSFAEVSSSPRVQAQLAAAYDSVDDMDVWAAGLAEDPRPGSMLGELLHEIVLGQFLLLRDGDRYWYQRSFAGEALAALENTKLADIIRRNTSIDGEISDDVFVVANNQRNSGTSRDRNEDSGQTRASRSRR